MSCILAKIVYICVEETMSALETLKSRSVTCELCSKHDIAYAHCVLPFNDDQADHNIGVCALCKDNLTEPSKSADNYWRFLSDAMWSPVAAVQVQCFQLLSQLTQLGWPQELLDTLYLDEENLSWAQSGLVELEQKSIRHLDCNGALLNAGDNVTITKDLNVKGTGFTAKRGTAVRSIGLVADNAKHIEGKVNGQRIVILTQFVKKS